MGTSHSIDEFLGKLNKLGTATDRSRKAIVTEGSLATKKVMLAAAAAKGVTPGGTIAGRKWTVRYDVKGTELPVGLVRFTGPFHLVNNPTQAHYIVAKGLGGSRNTRGVAAFQASSSRFMGGSTRGAFASNRRSRGKRALSYPGAYKDKAYAYVFHPGTSGKGIFQAAKAVAGRTVPPVMAASMKGAWSRALR